MGPFNVRPAKPTDAEGIAYVHVTSWRETYAGLIPDDYLKRLSIPHRATQWKDILKIAALDKAARYFVAEDPEHSIVGFGSCGAQSSKSIDASAYEGEFSAIYALRTSQRHGIGKRLMSSMAHSLIASGYKGGSLWVLRDNETARGFYEHIGGQLIGDTQYELTEGVLLDEVAYGWNDLNTLLT